MEFILMSMYMRDLALQLFLIIVSYQGGLVLLLVLLLMMRSVSQIPLFTDATNDDYTLQLDLLQLMLDLQLMPHP